MYIIGYKPSFIRQYKRLPTVLQEEVRERIELLKADPKHIFLKMHKLQGRLAGKWSISVNYAYRIVFQMISEKEIVLLAVGDHDVYDK